MNECDLRVKADDIKRKMRTGELSEDEVIKEIIRNPELVKIILPATTNLFLEAVNYNYPKTANKLVELGADIHLCCRPSLFNGNALNVAKTPEMAEWLLGCGIDFRVIMKNNANPGNIGY